MRQIIPSLRMFIFMTCLTGLVYPFAVTGIGDVFFPEKVRGSIVYDNGRPIGSLLIEQQFKSRKYFWPRPSAAGFSPLPSNASNLGPTSVDLKKAFDERRRQLSKADPDMVTEPPQNLLFASGSGLDPDISPQAAIYQVRRVAKARRMDFNQVMDLVQKHVQRRQWDIFGEPRVNVLELNLALDRIASTGSK